MHFIYIHILCIYILYIQILYVSVSLQVWRAHQRHPSEMLAHLSKENLHQQTLPVVPKVKVKGHGGLDV